MFYKAFNYFSILLSLLHYKSLIKVSKLMNQRISKFMKFPNFLDIFNFLRIWFQYFSESTLVSKFFKCMVINFIIFDYLLFRRKFFSLSYKTNEFFTCLFINCFVLPPSKEPFYKSYHNTYISNQIRSVAS